MLAALGRCWVAVAILMCCACSPRYLIVQSLGSELAKQRNEAEDDLVLAREASAFYLKLSESLLSEIPDNAPLAAAVSGGLTQYAYAFVQFDAERMESKDAKAAQRLRERALRLYQRAHRHAMVALERANPGITKRLESPSKGPRTALLPEQLDVAYWAAASWGALISLSKDDPEAVPDLPLAVELARLVWEQQPDYAEGAIASLMGSFESSRPGGSTLLATTYFDRAIVLGNGRNAGPYVAKAESVALPAGDRNAFEALLRHALLVSDAKRDLSNSVMRERALWLLEMTDDLF